MWQGGRKLRLIPAGLTSFGCRGWNTNPNDRFCQGLAVKLFLYMLQISLVSAGLTSFDRRKFMSMFSSRASYLCACRSQTFLLLLFPLSLSPFFPLLLVSSSMLCILFSFFHVPVKVFFPVSQYQRKAPFLSPCFSCFSPFFFSLSKQRQRIYSLYKALI